MGLNFSKFFEKFSKKGRLGAYGIGLGPRRDKRLKIGQKRAGRPRLRTLNRIKARKIFSRRARKSDAIWSFLAAACA